MLRLLILVALLLVAGLVGWRLLAPGRSTARADRILIEKGLRRLTLFQGNNALTIYRIALGRQPVGPKREEGDNRTPEGVYLIDRRKPDSDFHRALHISYPNEEDRAQAAARGVSPGGDIMIHGQPNAVGAPQKGDWTAGCLAVTNDEIEEIWRAVPNGTAVEIRP